MAYRYLFGPVNSKFADQNLREARQRGDCLAFDVRPGADLTIGLGDSWREASSRFPRGWIPDFIVLSLDYHAIPTCLWTTPVPIIGLAGDWNLLWHYYRHCLPRCDLVLTDPAGVETLARQGMHHARVANLFGCGRSFLETPITGPERDIDVLFVGNLNPAVQRERMRWLGRLAGLADRWRVHVSTGVYNNDYRALLARSRIVFNRSIRGECNCRAIEATAAGALLFQEAGNLEVPAYFQDRNEYVAYDADNLEELLTYYLEHEDERRAIAEAGHKRAQQYGFSQLWEDTLQRLEPELAALPRSPREPGPAEQDLRRRFWEALHTPRNLPQLVSDLEKGIANRPSSAALHHGLAAIQLLAGKTKSNVAPVVLHALRETLRKDPTDVLAALNLAELLALSGQNEQAMQEARQALRFLDKGEPLSPAVLDGAHLPPEFDVFRVEWERAAWQHAGQPSEEERAKRALLRWRLHSLLAKLTGKITHFYEAVAARPDLPFSQAALGWALTRANCPGEAVPYLARAVAGNPFDLLAAETLYHTLGAVEAFPAQQRHAEACRRMAVTAPSLVLIQANPEWLRR